MPNHIKRAFGHANRHTAPGSVPFEHLRAAAGGEEASESVGFCRCAGQRLRMDGRRFCRRSSVGPPRSAAKGRGPRVPWRLVELARTGRACGVPRRGGPVGPLGSRRLPPRPRSGGSAQLRGRSSGSIREARAAAFGFARGNFLPRFHVEVTAVSSDFSLWGSACRLLDPRFSGSVPCLAGRGGRGAGGRRARSSRCGVLAR